MSVQVTVFFHVNIVFVRLDVMVVMLKEQSSPLGTERYSHAKQFPSFKLTKMATGHINEHTP